MRIEDIFDDPDDIGASEYRLLYEFVADALKDMDAGSSDEEQRQYLIAVLNEIVNHAVSMIWFLNPPARKSTQHVQVQTPNAD